MSTHVQAGSTEHDNTPISPNSQASSRDELAIPEQSSLNIILHSTSQKPVRIPHISERSTRLPPSPPFCSLAYDPNTIRLSYSTNISFLHPNLNPSSFTRTIYRVMTKFYTLKNRDNYTFIPHRRQQAWVNNTMEMFAKSIEAANESLQHLVQICEKGGKFLSKIAFMNGRYKLLLERMQLLDHLMDGFVKSFDQATGSYASYLETEDEAGLGKTKFAKALTDEVAEKRARLVEYDRAHFNAWRKPEQFTDFEHLNTQYILEPPRYLLWDKKSGLAYVNKEDRGKNEPYFADQNHRGIRGRS